MAPEPAPPVRELDIATVVPIVVGAHIEAELTDRLVANRLRDRMVEVIAASDDGACNRLHPVVLTDLWYLNNQPLRLRPTIAIGRPEVNAATAYLARKVPTALVVEDAYRIQVDPEFIDVHACLWGTSPAATATAAEVFEKRHLERWLATAASVG
jgi:hypothetical protein